MMKKAQDSGLHPPNGKVRVLGDSQVKRLVKKKMKNIFLFGFGGLKSDQVLIKHKQIIEDKIHEVDEVILHVGYNDVPTRSPSRSQTIFMTMFKS